MIIKEVIDRILAYHPVITGVTCDGVKSGNTMLECTGIATTCVATVNVIRSAIERNINLIITHEPVFYSHMDDTSWLENIHETYDEKRELLEKHGIVVWRDHDHIHAHQPDRIYYGIMKELEWEAYVKGDKNKPVYYELPSTTARELGLYLKDKLGLNGVRMIGNLDAVISKVMCCGHLFPRKAEEDKLNMFLEADVLIPLEVIDWTVLNYARDAGQLGKAKAVINVGHFNWEEMGMKYAVNWLSQLVKQQVPVTFIPSSDLLLLYLGGKYYAISNHHRGRGDLWI